MQKFQTCGNEPQHFSSCITGTLDFTSLGLGSHLKWVVNLHLGVPAEVLDKAFFLFVFLCASGILVPPQGLGTLALQLEAESLQTN